MIERILHRFLTEGVTNLTKDPSPIVERFRDCFALTQSELDKIIEIFTTQAPAVRHGYARDDVEIPQWCIILTSEQETSRTLGDEFGIDTVLGSDTYGSTVSGSFWNKVHTIMTVTQHPDVTRYYYEICKLILVRERPNLIRAGLNDINYSGADLSPRQTYLPAHLFARNFVVSAEVDDRTTGAKVSPIRSIDGLHVEGGSDQSNGGVKTLVTVDTDGEAQS